MLRTLKPFHCPLARRTALTLHSFNRTRDVLAFWASDPDAAPYARGNGPEGSKSDGEKAPKNPRLEIPPCVFSPVQHSTAATMNLRALQQACRANRISWQGSREEIILRLKDPATAKGAEKSDLVEFLKENGRQVRVGLDV